MRAPDTCGLALALVLGAAAAAPPARAAEQNAWSFEASTEPSRVTLGTRDETWWINRFQASYRAGLGQQGYLAAESQKRELGIDKVLSAGMYGRVDDWLLSGQISIGIHPEFLPRYTLEPQIGRLFGKNLAVHAGAVYRFFPQSRVRIGSLAAIAYYGGSELELKLAFGDAQPLDRRIRVATVRWLWDNAAAVSYGGSVSTGRNLYDAINVPGVEGNRGWIVNANMRYGIDARSSIRLDLTLGREDPAFRQRSLGISYRRTF